MSEHNRREGYWQYYELAKEVEAPSLKRELIEIIRENPCPRRENGNRGRPPVHSKEKLDFACLLMMAGNNTYRGVESDLRGMRTPWDNEPVPDHTTLVRHLQTIPADWLDLIVAETARRCISRRRTRRRARWEPTAARRRPLGTSTSRGLSGRSALCRDTPKDLLEIPHNGHLGPADRAGGVHHAQQHQRHDHA